MDEQLPLFEIATEPSGISDAGVLIAPAIDPLDETEDVPAAPRHFISWDEVKEKMGWTSEQFADADTTTMSPVSDEDFDEEDDNFNLV